MASPLLTTVEVEPPRRAKASVIFLHGLGADGHDFHPIVPHLEIDPARLVRFVFPHAPKRSVTINGGFVMPAWFDVGMSDLVRAEATDLAGIKTAAAQVDALIAREIERGVPSNKIVVGGFSQGGALAACVALRHAQPLAGLIALSTFLPKNVAVETEATAANRALPVFGAHGTSDAVVPIPHGRKMRDRLAAIGCDVEWHEYPMQHEVCLEEIGDWGRWLDQKLR